MVIFKHIDWRLPVLRSIADTIEELYPSAAVDLRGIVKSMEPPLRPEDLTYDNNPGPPSQDAVETT